MKKYIALLYLIVFSCFADQTQTTLRQPSAEEQRQLELLLKTSEVTAEELEQLKVYAEKTVDMMVNGGIESFNYSEDSVFVLSQVIDREREGYSDKAKSVLPVVWGAYLGAAIIKKYDGKWVKMGDGSYGINVQSGQYVFPMMRVHKHIHNGSEDAIIALYQSIVEAQKKIDDITP